MASNVNFKFTSSTYEVLNYFLHLWGIKVPIAVIWLGKLQPQATVNMHAEG